MLEKPAVFCSQPFVFAHGPFLISSKFSSIIISLPTGSTTAPSFYSSSSLFLHPFVCFILIPHSQSLPSFFLSSSRSAIHHRLPLCQSVMQISLLLPLLKYIPFSLFLQAPEFHPAFNHSQHSSILYLYPTTSFTHPLSVLCSGNLLVHARPMINKHNSVHIK